MKMLVDNDMVCGLPVLKIPKKTCEGCLLSKQTRKSFPGQASFTAMEKLELVHCDLCGPIKPSTPAGNKYFMFLVDDYSRMMWVYMLKIKDEAFSAFKKFKVLVEKETKQEIKVLRTDRGGEFCSREFVEFCENAGVQ